MPFSNDWKDDPERVAAMRALPKSPPANPDNNPKTAGGLTKPALHAIPPVALLHLGGAMADGERKYGLCNWRDNEVSASVYYDAIQRHLLAWWDGEDLAVDSRISHLAHVMACCAILLDAESLARLNDDRPMPGAAGRMIVPLTSARA